MPSSKFTKHLCQIAMRSAEALDKLACTVITAIAVKHVATMFKEAHRAEDKADALYEQSEVLQAAAVRVQAQADDADAIAAAKLLAAEQEADELGVSRSRWA